MSTAHVNNGHRVALELNEFVGIAGFVQKSAEEAQLAFTPNARTGAAVAVGDVLDINDRLWRVRLREASPYVDNMVLLTLVTEPAATVAQGVQV